MKKSKTVTNHVFQLILGFFVIYVTASCVFDSRGLTPAKEKFYNCSTLVSNCEKKTDALDVDIKGNPLFPQINQYRKVYDLWGDKSKTYELYYDSNLSISNIELQDIKGSLLIQASYADWNNDQKDFLTITPLNEIGNLYIAYANVKDVYKPGWLKNEYAQVMNTHTSPYRPYYITSPSGKGGVLEVWSIKPEFLPKKGESVNIPGNIYDCNGCIGVNPSMYVVIIKPKVSIDCSKGVPEYRHGTEGCYDDLAKAKEKAQKDCNDTLPVSFPPPLQCLDSFCDSLFGSCPCTGEGCTVIGHALKIEPKSFLYHSEIEFNPIKYKSIADITIKDNHFDKQKVAGNLHFEYQYESNNMKLMKLNSMTLKIDPLDTDVGRFQDIVISLWKFSHASCKDTMPSYHQPCTKYEIPKEDLVVGLSAKLDGKALLFAGTNQNPISITIDHPTRTFKFQGPLHTMVKVDGKDTPLDISVDLAGHFVNFAPKAFGRESTRFAECGISRIGNTMKPGNKGPVKLDSAGSFGVYDTHLTNPPTYEWYEDFGLVTEKLWWTGAQYTIAPHNLGYGVHNFTLVVRDKNGLVDTDTFDIEVRDTIPPELTVPDIIIFQSPNETGPFKVDIDKALAYDSCSEKVMLSNNAPQGLLFPSGDTIVTWTADDGKGNVTTAVQKVSVIPTKDSVGDLIWDGSLHLMEIINKSMNAIEACKANPECMIDFEPLISALERLIGHVKEASVTEDKKMLRQRAVEKLEPALADLKEAHDFSKRSNEVETRGGMNLRNSALDKLKKARNLMGEANDISRGIK